MRSQVDDSGGFHGRGRAGEIYYTQFALMALESTGVDLSTFCNPDFFISLTQQNDFDLVDISGLARCLNLMGMADDRSLVDPLIDAISGYRARDGGYSPDPGAEFGTVYGTFVAACGAEDLGCELDTSGFETSLARYHRPDGGIAANPMIPISMTPATAAVVVLGCRYGFQIDGGIEWLRKSFRSDGGVGVSGNSPASDLLSTAVCLHALRCSEVDSVPEVMESTEKYVLSLISEDGGFRSCPDDSGSDVEYTFYGMLALGEIAILKEGRS